jgi:SAM-dependent methyltransferase
MHSDRIKWNRKYSNGDYPNRTAAVVKAFCGLASRLRALDIAAGNGRNAIFLARKGFRVDALDISDEGLRLFAGQHPNLRPACVDLDRYELAVDRYGLILNIKYLNRRLFPQVLRALIAGGVFIAETFFRPAGYQAPRPFCPDHLLEPNELLHAFLDLEIVYYREEPTAAAKEPYPLATLVGINR